MSNVSPFEKALALLPMDMRSAVSRLPICERERAEELRLRTGYPPSVLIGGAERDIPCRCVAPADLASVLEAATRASAHTAMAAMAAGYVTVCGGVRLGVGGEAVIKDGRLCGVRRCSSLCLRIPSARPVSESVWRAVTEGGFRSTLIVSPPGAGKTTLLRELTRRLSVSGTRVSLADERCEVTGMWEGTPMFDVGARTDVLSGAPKDEGVMVLLRSMSPEVVAMDEITCRSDIAAVLSAAGCGVKLLATAHAESAESLAERQMYRELLNEGIFRRAVTIRRRGGERYYEVTEL